MSDVHVEMGTHGARGSVGVQLGAPEQSERRW